MSKIIIAFAASLLCFCSNGYAADAWTEQIPASLTTCKKVFPNDLQLQDGCMENEKASFEKIKQYEKVAEQKAVSKNLTKTPLSAVENEFPSVACETSESCRKRGGELNMLDKRKLALPYFAAACLKGAAGSCQLIGRHYEKNPPLSFKWFRRSCEESQDLESCMPAISISLDKNDLKEATRLLDHCCSLDENQKYCMIYLDGTYFNNLKKKKKMVNEACKLGNKFVCTLQSSI